MRQTSLSSPQTGAPATTPRSVAWLLVYGALLSLAAAAPASAATLDWNVEVWPNGSLGPNMFTFSNGVTVSIAFSTSATGTFTNGSPNEDCAAGCLTNLFGPNNDLGVVFDPAAGQGASPVVITMTFSSPVTDVSFEISDVDFSIGGAGQDFRRDQVVVTSNAGNPTLTAKTGTPTFAISGNTATANCSPPGPPNCNPATDTTAAPSDNGTVTVDFGALSVTTVTINYNEAGGQNNPAGRGIGLFFGLTETPVELTGFSVE